MGERRLPFEGIRVCDFTWFAAGPIATKMAIGRAGEIGRARLEHDGWASEGPYEDSDEFACGDVAPQSGETGTDIPRARRGAA